MPQVWQNLGYMKNNPNVFFDLEEIKQEICTSMQIIITKIIALVPDSKRDYHAQIEIVANRLQKCK